MGGVGQQLFNPSPLSLPRASIGYSQSALRCAPAELRQSQQGRNRAKIRQISGCCQLWPLCLAPIAPSARWLPRTMLQNVREHWGWSGHDANCKMRSLIPSSPSLLLLLRLSIQIILLQPAKTCGTAFIVSSTTICPKNNIRLPHGFDRGLLKSQREVYHFHHLTCCLPGWQPHRQCSLLQRTFQSVVMGK